ncbi:hypothetical protein DL991_40980 [Amycolatopsis sp. WAC 01375]|uniref:helix-turn-helix domain-containing protein n=1 Tax=Amycolatopsis sp. WAC 01375 TaxID=2203194 RepID=UPI000F78BE81|nr:helix-turn-helix transcriptional regulator [Amycolatopsis sp. WAC 01375]RSM68952.1 hypothetical protein DL991_40980 [Amycolatopsis sp. WAC 01375]
MVIPSLTLEFYVTSDPSVPYTFAGRLNLLFEKVRHPAEKDRNGRHRNRKATELATALGVSDQYVSKLRKGKEVNPSLERIRGIAAFFEVSAAFLVDDDPLLAEYVVAQLDLYAALIDQELSVQEARQLLRAPSARRPPVLERLLRAKERYDESFASAHALSPDPGEATLVDRIGPLFLAPGVDRER